MTLPQFRDAQLHIAGEKVDREAVSGLDRGQAHGRAAVNSTRSRTACLVTVPDTTQAGCCPLTPSGDGRQRPDWLWLAELKPPPPWFMNPCAQHTRCWPGGVGLPAISHTVAKC